MKRIHLTVCLLTLALLLAGCGGRQAAAADQGGTQSGEGQLTLPEEAPPTAASPAEFGTQTGTDPITAEEARELALSRVPGASPDDIREFEAGYDRGRPEFEGKIYHDRMVYEFEIDARSGEFRSWEAEPVSD